MEWGKMIDRRSTHVKRAGEIRDIGHPRLMLARLIPTQVGSGMQNAGSAVRCFFLNIFTRILARTVTICR